VFFQEDGTLVVWHARDRSEVSLFTGRMRAVAPPDLVQQRLRALDGEGVGQIEPAWRGAFRKACCCRAKGSSTTEARCTRC
jgi:glycine oxidase